MIASFAALSALGRLAQAAEPYRVSLIGGVRDGENWRAGVAIDLEEGWKTYWRMPGEAGIPPQFDWTKSVGIAGVEILYPLPRRLHDLSGETVGYEHRVVFPITVKPAAPTEATLQLNLFLAVCKDICIPAKAEAKLVLDGSAVDTGTLEEWIKRVPIPGTAVRSVTAVMDGAKPLLVMQLDRGADDIFVEAEGPAYFRKPAFSPNGLEARLLVDNIKDAARLKGLGLKLTLAIDGSGIEQAVTVE
jgi:DsbC/DsbD-like thiol-disulfide interchange protein